MNSAYCNFKYTGDGTSCTASPDKPSLSPPQPVPPPSSKDDSSCSTPVYDAATSKTTYKCIDEHSYTNPGSINCGTVNGVTTCVAGSPPPKHESTTDNKTVTEQSNPDGSKNTTTTTTTTIENCTGLNSCQSTTTTTVSTSSTNANGTPGNTSSTCTGANCGTSDQRSDGTGDGTGDKPDSSVGGEDCAAQLACTGDAIQCAILRQQKLQQCADAEFRKVDPAKLKTDVQSAFTGTEFQPITPDANGTKDLSRVLDTSTRFASTCPVVPPIQYTWIDGTAQSIQVNDVFSQLCPYLSWMGYLVVAFAMRGAAEIIARGLV